MKFKYTILYVDNVADTLAFYSAAFSLPTRLLHDAGDYGELSTGDTTLSFCSLKLMSDQGKSPARAAANAPVFELAFETDTVRESLDQALQAGATLIQDMREEPWGQTTSYVADPNGFLIEICSPVQASSAQP